MSCGTVRAYRTSRPTNTLAIARIILQCREDAGDGNGFSDLSIAQRSSPLRDEPSFAVAFLLVDLDVKVDEIDRKDAPDDQAEGVRVASSNRCSIGGSVFFAYRLYASPARASGSSSKISPQADCQ